MADDTLHWVWLAGKWERQPGVRDRHGKLRKMFLTRGDTRRGYFSSCALTIHREKRRRYWVMNDPVGETMFSRREALFGPFSTLREAKVNYLIYLQAGGEHADWT